MLEEENTEQMVMFTTSFTFAYVSNACKISRNVGLPERRRRKKQLIIGNNSINKPNHTWAG